jgi:hypothetical protein
MVTGETIETSTVNLQPGDQWGNVTLKVRDRIDTVF